MNGLYVLEINNNVMVKMAISITATLIPLTIGWEANSGIIAVSLMLSQRKKPKLPKTDGMAISRKFCLNTALR